MQTRNTLSANQIGELHEELGRKLCDIGLPTQPAVAAKILDLTRDPEAGLIDYAKLIANDAGLCGRLIRLANSAHFAQRKPVTGVDRACVLLGMERLRSIALGFYLAQSSTTDPNARITREVWGQSVFRACLAAEIARGICPELASEAFVVGLMIDAGMPLAHQLLGPRFEVLYDEGLPPLKGFAREFELLPFTHVDVVTTLVRRWEFPDVLAKPIAWHHAPPAPIGGDDPARKLHRVAYYVGAVSLRADGTPQQQLPMPTTAEIQLEIGRAELREIVARSSDEYGSVLEIFEDVADAIESSGGMAEQVQHELVQVLDEQMAGDIRDWSSPKPQKFKLGGLTVLIKPEEDGMGSAFAYDTNGEPLSTFRFLLAAENAGSIREGLGLNAQSGDEESAVTEYIEQAAA